MSDRYRLVVARGVVNYDSLAMAMGGGKQVLRPPPLKIASTAEHVHRVATRAREGHGGRKVDTKDADETGEARSTAPRAGRRGGR